MRDFAPGGGRWKGGKRHSIALIKHSLICLIFTSDHMPNGNGPVRAHKWGVLLLIRLIQGPQRNRAIARRCGEQHTARCEADAGDRRVVILQANRTGRHTFVGTASTVKSNKMWEKPSKGLYIRNALARNS